MYDTIVTLKKGTGRTLKSGGMWVYDNEIESIAGTFENGGLVTVHDFDGYFLGIGFINTNSKITVRLLSRKKGTVIDEAFLEKRAADAWEYRKQTMDTGCCRVIFGEADWLPGLVVDKFSDVLVVESLALGIDRLKPVILEGLCRILQKDGIVIRGIYERSDAKVRLQEGMERFKGFIGAPFDTKVQIEENGVKYIVDVEDGQKTGFFLDQKYNRAAIARIAKGKHVLDCFTHTGSFALNAARGGAKHVHAVDISQTAIDMAQEHAKRNHLEERMSFETADVFELLKELKKQPRIYDMIILDPPAFTKSRETISHAVKGYRQINTAAMKLLPRGGYLATCSCSHFMNEGLFKSMLHESAAVAGVELRQVEARQQCCDHPILWNVPETAYLKFYIFQIA